jgi:hypothetical protein
LITANTVKGENESPVIPANVGIQRVNSGEKRRKPSLPLEEGGSREKRETEGVAAAVFPDCVWKPNRPTPAVTLSARHLPQEGGKSRRRLRRPPRHFLDKREHGSFFSLRRLQIQRMRRGVPGGPRGILACAGMTEIHERFAVEKPTPV